ncbi:MAG: septal ring lytic transglycosylase RlpA family protein [Proteobacteria bacterium]|nr:septal ring lytic transglycosylase RlpA family protein [Pseudomonadota bacterium]
MLRATAALTCALALAACSSAPYREPPQREASAPAQSPGPARPGGYYKDDGPGANPPDLDKIPDAQPKREPLHRFANNPYQVFGKDYVPLRVAGSFRERGIASWYGRRYNGQKTSSGEIYDMYAMTAAHPTLPIPSYARVTNLANGRSVVVRVNDRGPFHSDRVMDLSYVAAYRLGYVQAGSALVEVESLAVDGTQVAAAVAPRAAPAPEAPAPVAAPLPVSTNASGVFLQLGAFSVRDNADLFRAKVYKELAWLNDPIEVSAQGSLFRLQLGPYRTQDDARQMAERIQKELNLRPVLLVR